MSFLDSLKTCFIKSFDFTGRASRMEFWSFVLFALLLTIAFAALMPMIMMLNMGNMMMQSGGSMGAVDLPNMYRGMATTGYVWLIIALLLAMPFTAVLIRRLRDAGKSVWWVFLLYISTSMMWLATYQMFGKMSAEMIGNMQRDVDNMNEMMQAMQTQQAAFATLANYPPFQFWFKVFGGSMIISVLLGSIVLVFTLLDSQHKRRNSSV